VLAGEDTVANEDHIQCLLLVAGLFRTYNAPSYEFGGKCFSFLAVVDKGFDITAYEGVDSWSGEQLFEC
jgi:hypothetical protein